MNPKPFLKWAGGKYQLFPQIAPYLPSPMPPNYAELFVGAGGMFWNLTQQHRFDNVILNDANSWLINCYRQIQANFSDVIVELQLLESLYLEGDREQLFNFYKNEFNSNWKYNSRAAALLIFLNKTCYNGLYRVNKKGLFNTSHGKYKKPLICDRVNLGLCSEALQRTIINYGSFENYTGMDQDIFIYLDPPYKPISKTSNFTGYQHSFTDTDQKLLAQYAQLWHEQGAKIMVSNSYHPEYFQRLYPNFRLIEIDARRSINSKGDKRQPVKELLLINY